MMNKDGITVKGNFTLEIYEVGTGKIIDHYADKNLVLTLGHGNLAKLLGGHASGHAVTKIGMGTNGTAPTLADTALTGLFSKAIDTISYPDSNSIKFEYEILPEEANGMTIMEFGLLTSTDVLFARKVRSAIIKTDAVGYRGSWKIFINS